MDAKKQRRGREEALALLAEVDEVYATKGKTVQYFDMKRHRPDAQLLLAAVIGPSGNLRAPTLRRGRTLIVGFDEELYRKLLK